MTVDVLRRLGIAGAAERYRGRSRGDHSTQQMISTPRSAPTDRTALLGNDIHGNPQFPPKLREVAQPR